MITTSMNTGETNEVSRRSVIVTPGNPKGIGMVTDLVRSGDIGDRDPLERSAITTETEIGNTGEDGHETQNAETAGRTGLGLEEGGRGVRRMTTTTMTVGQESGVAMRQRQQQQQQQSSATDPCRPKTTPSP